MKTAIRVLCVMSVLFTAASAMAQTPTAVKGSIVPDNKIVLTVNGEPVRMSDISTAAQGVASAAARNGVQVPQERIVEMATAQVIDAILLSQLAAKEGVKIDQVELGTALQEMVKRAGSRENLDARLAETGMTFELLREGLQTTMLARAYVDQKIRPGLSVSDEEAKAFYAENPQFFQRPEQVRASHILITVAEDADETTVAAAEKKAQAAYDRAKAGEDFATLAKEVSEGPSGPNGGELGWFAADQMVKPFTEAAFATKPGNLAPITRTNFGFHVIKVEEHRPATTLPFDDVQQNIKLNLVERKVSEAADAKLTPLRESAEIVPNIPEGYEAPTSDPKE